jgi:hypothetical protein
VSESAVEIQFMTESSKRGFYTSGGDLLTRWSSQPSPSRRNFPRRSCNKKGALKGPFYVHATSGLIVENETRTLRARIEIRAVVTVQNGGRC